MTADVSPRVGHRLAALGTVATLLAGLLAVFGLFSAPSAQAAVRPGDVVLSVADVRPNTPELTQTPKPLQISLTLVNHTGQTLQNVIISGARSDPIYTQRALDAAIAHPRRPSDEYVAPLDTTVRLTLAPHATADVDYRTTYAIPTTADLCTCANAIYPLYFTADYTPPDGPTVRLSTTQTYLPSFTEQPAKARVGWVWPLLDRPHRLLSDTLFLDDDLAREVAPGGRLDRLLQVVEAVGDEVPMTLLIDPDVIDELAVMSSSTGYRVKSSTGPVPGTGGQAAAAWLQRLRDVLLTPGVEVSFTPFADPPVETLARAGLPWTATRSPAVQARVTAALGGLTPSTDIAWPVKQTISSGTLSTLVGEGTNTVILSDRTLPKGHSLPVVPDALAPLHTDRGRVTAAVTSGSINSAAQTVLRRKGPGLGALPELVAQLAIRVVTSTDRSHYILVTPPRNLTVDPHVAERTILATAQTVWSGPLPLRAATSAVTPVDHGQLSDRVSPPQLPDATVRALRYTTQSVPGLKSLYHDPADAVAALGTVPVGVQRAESTSLLPRPDLSVAYAQGVAAHVRSIRNHVVLLSPSKGTYTLPSKNSRLPITVSNRLPAQVDVVIGVTGGTGLHATPVTRSIAPDSTVQVRVPTHVDRVGRIDVQVNLSTPDGLALGGPITLTVHSTALGTVGIWITVVAAVVLVAALLFRFGRRLRARRRRAQPPPEPEPVPAATATP